ncbi:MAG: ATP synthase F1 subunit delta [Eubacteriales bacterium]|nr:ATP synthase F1 subunit delta [Eubacteriales bacterium]
MAKLVSKTYGDALFDLAIEEKCVDAMTQEVELVQKSFAENPELSEIFANPDICKDEKIGLIERIFKGRVSDNMAGFLRIVVIKQRFGDLNAILNYFVARAKEYKKIGVAKVTSPTELSGEWKSKIEQKLLDTTGYTTMEMSYEVKPELIGGLIIRIGDTVVDSSIQSKLTEIRNSLMKTSLENK